MKIKYTRHALKKFKFLEKIGWKFRKSDIRAALQNPNYYSQDEKRGVTTILKETDERHNELAENLK